MRLASNPSAWLRPMNIPTLAHDLKKAGANPAWPSRNTGAGALKAKRKIVAFEPKTRVDPPATAARLY